MGVRLLLLLLVIRSVGILSATPTTRGHSTDCRPRPGIAAHSTADDGASCRTNDTGAGR